jgi:hypothetical protein
VGLLVVAAIKIEASLGASAKLTFNFFWVLLDFMLSSAWPKSGFHQGPLLKPA